MLRAGPICVGQPPMLMTSRDITVSHVLYTHSHRIGCVHSNFSIKSCQETCPKIAEVTGNMIVNYLSINTQTRSKHLHTHFIC